ncbi:DUF4097 family beta strand repeat-containing protein [Neobacillus cucumis]|uniref:DUF4097 family beta strand repeat-containing protein n=1 Tax=Neobacillus cucumis TaxID=1740721 RepID=UPI00203EDBA9|nr:DUF4097 domain-containing protein [Neobacillus cucumis]MCM3727639.1 DUF4097 family beta strand repeat-containing protein [Neobacillus cucumis]
MKEERKRILQMVEEGKLKADEALKLLEELEKAEQSMEQKQAQLVNELSTTVQFEEAKKEEPFQAKYQSTKDKIFEFVDFAFKKIKDLDLDLNFGQSVDISHIFHQGEAAIKDIDIDVANGAIKLVGWEQPDVRVECQAKVYRVENQDQARQNFLRDVLFTVEHEKLRFSTQQKWMKVEAVVYVPKAVYNRVRVRLFNGPITGEQMNVDELRVKTANGKISLDRFTGKNTELETANGKIKLKGSQFDKVEAETINGAIQLAGEFKKLEMESFKGNISVNLHGNQAELIQAKTAAGGIDLYIPDGLPVNGNLRTNLGGFHVNLVGIQVLEEKSEMIQKSLRFQSINHPEKLAHIYADTKTGSITIHQSQEEK